MAVADKNKEHESGIFVSKKKSDFTIITNKVLSANTLSLAALGLYMAIARKITIPNFVLYKHDLQKSSRNKKGNPLGARAFQTAWDELKNTGYLKQYRIRTSTGFRYQYELLEEPNLERPALIMVRLCEELVEDEQGHLVIRNKAVAEEEQSVVPEEIKAIEGMDLVGEKKNIIITGNLDVKEKDKEYVAEIYEKVGYDARSKYKFNAGLNELSQRREWERKQACIEEQRQDKLSRIMPILRDKAGVDHIVDDDDRKMAEEILDAIGILVAPADDNLVHICGNHWPQVKVFKNIMDKLTPETMDRTIVQIKNYDKPIKDYAKFMRTTLFNNVLTYNTWFAHNFELSSSGHNTDGDFMRVKRN